MVIRIAITHPHSVMRITYRIVAGKPVTGRRITNSTFLRPADTQYDAHEHVRRWHYRPGWYRAAWRLGTGAALASMTAAELAAPILTDAVLSAGVAGGTAYGTMRGVRAYKVRKHTARYVRPLGSVLARMLGMPANTSPGAVVSVPMNFADPDYSTDETTDDDLPNGTVRVTLPENMPDIPDLQRSVLRQVAAKLGLDPSDVDARWNMIGSKPYATFRRAPRPPKRVMFADVQTAFGQGANSAPVLGIGAREKVVRVDLDLDSPHVALSMGSGAGKSVLLRAIIAQFLHNGCQVFIGDVKRISQSWAKDLPGVRYMRTGEEIHDGLMAFQTEIDRRNGLLDAVLAEDEDSVDVGPRLIFIFEEQGAGVPMLVKHWNAIRTKDDPKRSPALDALDFGLMTGRQVKCHVISVAQMFTVATAGGNPAARENYGIRGLGRATRNAWLMLAPECGPQFPKSSKQRGRIHVVIAGEATEVQCVFMTIDEAREWASSGAMTVPVGWDATAETTPEQVRAPGQGQPPVRYTLASAARQPWCTLTYEALKKTRQRSPEWPKGQRRAGREQWTEEELRAALGLDQDASAGAPQ